MESRFGRANGDFLASTFTKILKKSSSCCLFLVSLLAVYLLIKAIVNTFVLPPNYRGFYGIKIIRVNLDDGTLKSIFFNPF